MTKAVALEAAHGGPLADDEAAQLRQAHYNAKVVELSLVHSDLMILRVRPDWGSTDFLPGQYSVIGLGNWEPRVADVQAEELDEDAVRRVLKRAYSFSCGMLDGEGKLRPPSGSDVLEFYIVLIRRGEVRPPGLTPRLFALSRGDRLFVGPKVSGHYTLDRVHPDDDVCLVATGTGEAPHNAMLAELLSRGHRGRLVCVTCARRKQDLGYMAVHRELERRYPRYRYRTLTTREPENLDPLAPGFVGKRYLQEYVTSGDFEREADFPLDPASTHVFLCGNPAMIGAPLRGPHAARRYPEPIGMVEILEGRGFTADEHGRPGNIHFEKYW